MSNTTRTSGRWRSLPLFAVAFWFPILIAAPLTGLIALTAVSFATFFTMGRTVLGRSDIKKKKHSPALPDRQLATVQIEDTTCLICQETVGARSPEGVTEVWSMLPCGHSFGSHCIKTYLGIAADEHPLCPICRHAAFHEPCGHPVLPFVLGPDGTHRDLVTDASGKVFPPIREEDLKALSCRYCMGVEESVVLPLDKHSAAVAKLKRPFVWLRDRMPLLRRKRTDILADAGLAVQETSDEEDRRLTRQEARTRRRTQAYDENGHWNGPWVDVQTKDTEWEKWWSEQVPRGACQ
jgi:HUS1 checkpoint protein